MSIVMRIGMWLIFSLVVLVLTVYFVRAIDSRRMAELGPEYRIEFEREFDASQEHETDWSAYLAIEDALASELEEKIDSDTRPDSLVDRFSAGSRTFPGNYPRNWNRTYEMSAPTPRGVAVLLHGLTDSPYSMRSTAQTMVDAGYNVVVPRMPGHGFAVGGLVQARWEDWTAAVRIAVRHAVTLQGGDQALLLVGYSNGGLMAVDYALQCDQIAELPCPDGLVLLSPAIAVTTLAAVANWHAAVSWLPFFEKFKWLSILPEIDPFKFTSFPKRAAWEIYKISSRTHEQLGRPADAGRLPPVLTFQSVVDNTVSASAIVTNLYDRLPANGSELVVYDINRNSTLLHLMREQPGDPVEYFESAAPSDFGVTILRNRDPNSIDVDTLTVRAGQDASVSARTDLRWPTGVYSLSHIAVPFRPDDEVYGDGMLAGPGDPGIVFGALAPRGEQGVLGLTSDYFLRARYNPFFEFQQNYLIEWLERR